MGFEHCLICWSAACGVDSLRLVSQCTTEQAASGGRGRGDESETNYNKSVAVMRQRQLVERERDAVSKEDGLNKKETCER